MDKSRLEQLKAKNKRNISRRYWEQNVLFQDCLHCLEDVQLLESEDSIREIICSMEREFPLNMYRHIDGAHELSAKDLDFAADHKWYIVWDNALLPVVKCSGASILKCLDDVFAVSFDTYIFDDHFMDITHSDESGRLWRYSRLNAGAKGTRGIMAVPLG